MALALDRIDAVSIVGFLALAAVSAAALEGVVVAAVGGGFALSLSTWRLYGGRPWEALAWLAWVGAAVAVVIAPGTTGFVAFLALVVVGLGLLFGGRLGLLPAIWDRDGAAVGDESVDGPGPR
ncbi:hypothetical protein Htur_0807 [Haloterrigena turkmenica DSM 5511]|uniref:Uncharacterized protein n=1 Tax=Haloterrigena turkmenica (strain ATCC 51198 / DSM 5511 / JCM 9101 / NCIMB 13204 / VKM B-1734 / 4k) TaxID=543526 RepID=D2RX91_HALTV|nr:hypothetical protein [Haloterrigena turkmenica]ADB59703.1 hypothetical protein Htur_0807 [Haloterrigena turkmenica DSM 5511]